MSNLKKVIVATLLLGLVIMAVFSYYVYANVLAPNTSFNNAEAHIFIPSDATFTDVLEEVYPLIDDIESFKRVAHKKKYSSHIKSGHFVIKKGMNNNEIINAIRSGNIPVKVKFNNQERLENLAGTIAKQLEPDSLTFLETFKDPKLLSEYNLTLQTALSMFIPNTYEMYWNTSPKKFVEKMNKEYHKFWNKNRLQKAKQLGLTPEEIITLASIVQKETVKADERPRVAGVYVNRLKRGIPLQADPTVIYAVKLASGDFNKQIKRVLYKDLETDSPYNTYKNAGLPPGPITMPDISSIDAVLNYEKHDYLYFAADVTNFGYHKFAKTLAQHNRNARAYQKWLSNQGVNR